MSKIYEVREAKVHDLGGNLVDGWEVVDVEVHITPDAEMVSAVVLDNEFADLLKKILP